MRLAVCSRKLHSEAARCQALWDHVLAHGRRLHDLRVRAAAGCALTAALEAGSKRLGRVGQPAGCVGEGVGWT